MEHPTPERKRCCEEVTAKVFGSQKNDGDDF